VRKWLAGGEIAGKHREEAEQCLDLIAGESRRCGDLVKNLLTFSRTAPMNPEFTDLNQVVDRLIRLVQHELEMTGVQLHRELQNDLPRITCDPAQIEQVLLALVMNAIDAMPRGGNLWIQTRFRTQPQAVELEVRDDGCGIDNDILPHIFEPFLTTKESGHGVGLGLAISHSIIERHHGSIEVHSAPGKGTTFSVSLPLAEHEHDAASDRVAAAP
jgi:two-component system, NtrC family, sensor kinase